VLLAPPALWSGPRPTRSAARSRPPRAETLPLPATYRWPCRLLRSQPDQPSHGRGNASSRPFGNGRWGGAGRLNGLVSPVSAGATPRFAGHAGLPSLTAKEGRRPLDRSGRSWQRAGDGRDAKIAKDWAAVEGWFEIGMNRAQCRCLAGLLETVQPDDTTLNQLARNARGRAKLGKARQSANPSGCGSG
jgi:hypothetical protein